MTEKYPFEFGEWYPDLEPYAHTGLVVADNLIHDEDGYKPIHKASAGAFSTTGGLAASSATILSCIAKPVGSQGDVLCAWLADATAPTLHVGFNGVTATTSATGHPLQFATNGASGTYIYAFDVCELEGKVFFTVEARNQTVIPVTTVTLRTTGYIDF